ncbi:MAG: hypothetical protein LQ340_000364 [Diploschistes diacapsis]|nr:MAG: hypothetical protein LQ340_000364 [Diploschistes diacapsis]
MADDILDQIRASLIQKLNAQVLAENPYYNGQWPVTREQSLEHIKEIAHTLRVFYLPRYFPLGTTEIRKLITCVPYICTAGDSYVQTQDQTVQSSLLEARRKFPDLISNEERRLSRAKCIASVAKCYAIGGYKNRLKPLKKSEIFDCVVISGAGPQFEASYLDFADFIFTKHSTGTRLKQYSSFGDIPDTWNNLVEAAAHGEHFLKIGSGSHIFHKTGYLVSMTECMHLWLTAFDRMVQEHFQGRSGYFKISAIGCGFFSDVAGAGINIGTTLMPVLVKAIETACGNHSYPNIACLEFCDFSKDGSFAPTCSSINGIKTVHGPRSDILDFFPAAKKKFVVGCLNPSDCFACVGNETHYQSVESMIGDNTTIRLTQCYLWNRQVLDTFKYIEIR